jgi:hypothetical protein
VTHPIRRALRTLAAAAALAACGKGGDSKEPPAGPLPPGTKPIAENARYEPPARTAECYASPIRIVFHSRMEWDAFWTDERRGCTPPPVPEGVDFSRDMLVYASMGKRMAPEDRIDIVGSGVRNDSVIVAVRRVMLAGGCTGEQPKGPTFPQSLVRIPADTVHPLRFSEEHRRIPCDQP